jgi:hypothetical protein
MGEIRTNPSLNKPNYSPVHHRTAVVHYPDGTTANLAKIPGSARYTAVIERLMKTDPASRQWCGDYNQDWEDLWWKLRRPLAPVGIATSSDVRAMGNMLYQLRKQSERALGVRITSASVALVRRQSYSWQNCRDRDLNDALHYAGLIPWADVVPAPWSFRDPAYLDEGMAVMGGSGRLLCEPWGCGDPPSGTRLEEVFHIR